MIKIAIVFSKLIVGGAEKSLVNFLRSIDYSKYEVYLYTIDVNNDILSILPDNIHIISTECDISRYFIKCLKNYDVINIFRGIILRIFIHLTKR